MFRGRLQPVRQPGQSHRRVERCNARLGVCIGNAPIASWRSSITYQALAILEDGPETPELARAISSISQMYMLMPRNDLAIVWGERALAMAERLGAEDIVVHALNNIASGYNQQGNFETGLPIARETMQRALAAGLPMDACRANYNLAVALQRQCNYAEARELLEQLLIYATQVYAKSYVNLALWRLMWIDWLTGHWSSALAHRARNG